MGMAALLNAEHQEMLVLVACELLNLELGFTDHWACVELEPDDWGWTDPSGGLR